MSDQFDPFYTWLGIPPDEQPPDHYRLLGVRRFENNPEVIGNALERQVSHIRSHVGGPRDAAANRMLGLLSEVRACLLNSDRKGAYDRELRQKDAPTVAKGSSSASPMTRPSAPKKPAPRAAATSVPVATVAPPAPVSDPGLVPVASFPPDPQFAAPAPKPPYQYAPQPAAWQARPSAHLASRPLWQQPLVLLAAVLVGMSVMGVLSVAAMFVGWQMLPRGNPRPTQNVAGIPPTIYSYPPLAQRPGVNVAPKPRTPTSPEVTGPLSFKPAGPTVQVQPASKGFALQFNGSSAYVEIENTQDIATLDNPATIELWVRWQDDGKGQTLMGNQWAKTERGADGRLQPWTGWYLCAKREGGGNKIFHFYTMGTGPHASGLDMNDVTDESRWHHFAYTCDGLGGELYIDGRKARQRVKPGVKGNVKQNLCLGASKEADPSFSRLRGEICAFRISSTKRYTRHFEPPTTFEKDADTIGLLDFSRDQGSTIEDLSGQGHTGKITGATWVAR